MTSYCDFHEKEHDHFEWRTWCAGGGLVTYCRDALEASSVGDDSSFNVGLSKNEKRIQHWAEIKSRTTTHEGQLIAGSAGRDYQKKWSKKMLGTDLSQPANFNAPQYQKELAKTK